MVQPGSIFKGSFGVIKYGEHKVKIELSDPNWPDGEQFGTELKSSPTG